MIEGICMCFYKPVVQSMFKYVASENAPLVSFNTAKLFSNFHCIKVLFKVALFCRASSIKKSKYCCHPPFHPPIFRRRFFKNLSPTLPILMKWILLSPPPLSSDPDNPQNLERAPGLSNITGILVCQTNIMGTVSTLATFQNFV